MIASSVIARMKCVHGALRLRMPGTSSSSAGQHGSWNRTPPSGFKVSFVPFAYGKPSGDMVDFVSGFLGEDGKARGRPVGVAVDPRGALLVADDLGNTTWRVTPVNPAAAPASAPIAAAQASPPTR